MHVTNYGETLARMLDLWVDIAGVSPDATQLSISLSGKLSTYDLKKMHDEIREMTAEDDGLTATLLLRAFFAEFCERTTLSLAEAVRTPPAREEWLEKVRTLDAMLHDGAVRCMERDFLERVRAAAWHYGFTFDLDNAEDLVFVRRDAIRTARGIRVNQFAKGKPNGKPGYHIALTRFPDFASLLGAASRMPSGAALNVVQPDGPESANFVFAVRNGENLYLCSDKERWDNPFREGLSRRPDRDLERRAENNRFPYQLLFEKPSEESVPVLREEGRRLCLLKDLPSDQMLWIAMLFDLLTARFWAPDYAEPSLSALSGQIVPASTAIGGVNLPASPNPSLALPKLSLDEVRNDKDVRKDFQNGFNEWMSERYGGTIDPNLLEISTGEKLLCLPAIPGYKDIWDRKKPGKPRGLMLVSPMEPMGKDLATGENIPHSERDVVLRQPDFSRIGTIAEIDADRHYIARYNYAKLVERKAIEEFLERRDEIAAWYTKAVQRNLDRLARIGVQYETLWAFFPHIGDSFRSFLQTNQYCGPHYLFMNRTSLGDGRNRRYSGMSPVVQATEWKNGKPLCLKTGQAASWSILWEPHTAADLAFMTQSDLPDVLQTWYRETRHPGNHILDKLDPLDWACRNPWEDMNFNVHIHLSKRGFATLSKQGADDRAPYLTGEELPKNERPTGIFTSRRR